MNPTRTFIDNFQVSESLPPQVVAAGATVNGTAINLQGCEEACAVISIGAIVVGATKTIKVHLEASPDGTNNFVAIKDQDAVAAETPAVAGANSNKIYTISLNVSELGANFWVRAVAVGGAADGGLVGVNIIKGRLRYLPPVQDTTPLYIQS